MESVIVDPPEEGMEFDSHESAYNFYKEYAKSAGFGTAKLSSRRSRASKEFIDAKFSCIRYGSKQHSDEALNPRPSPKIGCPASLHVKRRHSSAVWYVHSFVSDHNHDLLPNQSHFFRSHRRGENRRSRPSSAAGAPFPDWIRPSAGDESSLALDSGILLRRLAVFQDRSPEFFYALDFTSGGRLRSAFWAHPEASRSFSRFPDAVSLDASRVSNSHALPLALFVGVNHHLQPILLGCGLLSDDSLHSFSWLIHTWLSCVARGGSQPKAFLADPAVGPAAAALLPNSRHFYPLWNASPPEQTVKKPFEKEEIEKGFFLAGLSTRSRSESPNAFFDKYVENSIVEFMEKGYPRILEEAREAEAGAEFDSWHSPSPELKSPSPFEKQASLLYTREVFEKFRSEVLGAAACHLKKEIRDGPSEIYSVKDFGDGETYSVEFDEHKSEIDCACRSFELKGYLCRHAVVVLQMSGVLEIPAKYVLRRWTAAATSAFPATMSKERENKWCNELCRRAVILAEEGSLSPESYEVALRFVREALRRCASSEKSSNTSAVVVGSDNDGKGTPLPVVPSPAPAIAQSVPSASADPHDVCNAR